MGNQIFCGYDIGVLVMKSWVPKPPGHISCAQNYDFPVYYYPVDKTDNETVHNGSKKIVPYLVEAVKELKEMGCRAIVSSCGYFGHFQDMIAGQVDLPVYLSAMCMAPFIFRMMAPDKKLAVICYNKEKLTESLFESCGIGKNLRDRCVVYDIIGEPELGKIITDCGHYNITKARSEAVEVALKALRKNPDIGAFLLECTDLPPHSYAIQEATNMPVFDATMMVEFIHNIMESNRNIFRGGVVSRLLIITVAGMSTRFSSSVGYDCLKCLYHTGDFRESLLYRLLHQPVRFDKYILVGGYKFDELRETVNREFADLADRIVLVENPHYKDYGSGYSLYYGLREAMRYELSQVVFVEGDLFMDTGTFARVCESPKDAVTCTSESITAEKSVVFYLDSKNHLHYLYDMRHTLLSIREPFRAIYNSGQVWKFANPVRLRNVYAGMAENDWKGTNLVLVERYFGQMDRREYELFRFSEWVNCNTVEDFKRLPAVDIKKGAQNKHGGQVNEGTE